MVFKDDVLQWFRELESYERISLMHDLLHMCLPFEIRFLGGCVEEIGKHSFQELRGKSIVANDIDKLSKDSTQFTAGVLDRNCRHRMCIYLSLLENRNCQCAHWYFKQVFRTEQWDEFAMRQKCVDDDGHVLNELLMVFTLGRLHPAFNYHQKEFFGDVLEKLYRIRADKMNVVKSNVGVGMPNYPPGFGYPNQIVPSYYVIQYDQSSTPTPHQVQPQPLHQQQQQQQQQLVDTLCVGKTSTASSASSTSSVLSTAAGGAAGELVLTPQPGLVQHQQAPFQQYDYNYVWRQQLMYNLPDPHMMAPPPQPNSPLVSHSASPPHSRPSSPSPTNHGASAQSQQHQHRTTPSSSLRGSKSSSLDSHSSPQPSPLQSARMPSMSAGYSNTPPASGEQAGVKMGDNNESNHIMTPDDCCTKPVNNCQQPQQYLPQDWSNQGALNHMPTQMHPHFAFAAHPHPQMAPHTAQPPNGLRHCFAANFLPQHHISMDPPMFGYDFDYQQHQPQQLNDMPLENTLHQSGSSSNNSSNASSLNQSPPDTPVSTPTPALHGPGRGSRDGGTSDKLRMLNNVNSIPYMAPPPPPISDGGNMPPQQHFAYNVPYTSLGGGRQIFTRIPPTFTHSFPAPPSLAAQQQQQHVLAAHAQGQLLAPYITIGSTTGLIMSPNMINSNGNYTMSGTGHNSTNTASLRLHPHHHSPHQSSTSATNQQPAPTANQHTAGACAQPAPPCGSEVSYCCNCGSSEHSDHDCTAPRIDDIVTQRGYTLAYDDNSKTGVGAGGAASAIAALATPTVDGGHHRRTPDV